MDTGAPMPSVYSDETGLTCAYVIGATHSESGSTAVLHFEGVLYYAMGYPNDEVLNAHPLYANGLGFYGCSGTFKKDAAQRAVLGLQV